MATNIQINRIKSKLKKMFKNSINMENVKVLPESDDFEKMWYSRAYAAYSTFLIGSENIEDAASSVTDGFGDNGIDAIFNDKNKKFCILYKQNLVMKQVALFQKVIL